jgi:hypothetical protein
MRYLILLVMLIPIVGYGQETKNILTIKWDDSAVRTVLSNPEYSLIYRDSIWNSFEGYRQTLAWHKRQDVPVDFEFYEFALNDMLSDSPSFTKDKNYLATIDRIQEIFKNTGDSISKHISSYLPSDSSFTSYAYFVAFTTPYAFSLDDKLVIDIGSPRWYLNPEYIINIVIHETYHVGYEIYTPDNLSIKPTDKDNFLQSIYNDIHNEGMATFVSYKALDIVPSEYKDRDYQLLEKEENIDKAFKQINQMIVDCEAVPLDTIVERAWNIGTVKDRAFYITGAYICGEIEKIKGKEYLVGLVRADSKKFIEEYNLIAIKDRKIEL